MTIRFADGRSIEGIVLSHQPGLIRCIVRDVDDVTELTARNGLWYWEGREPVEVEFAWQVASSRRLVTEFDCICSKELALSLIDSLLEESPEPALPFARPQVMAMGMGASAN